MKNFIKCDTKTKIDDTKFNESNEMNEHELNNIDSLKAQLISAIRDSEEYKTYHGLLNKIKLNHGVYQEVNHYRQRCLELQISSNVNFVEENTKLQNEFDNVLCIPLARDFIFADMRLCKMIKNITNEIVNAGDIDIDFLD